MTEYPEHEKMSAIREQSQAIGEFLEWLQCEKKITLGEWKKRQEDGETEEDIEDRTPRIIPISISNEKLLSEFFSIDLDKIEQEKLQMLEEIRKANRW